MDGRTAAAVLGVNPVATRDELVRAFRARAKIAHPDTAGTDEAFVLLRSAFEFLLPSARPAGPDGPAPAGGPSAGRDRTGAWFVSRLRPEPGTIDLTDSPVSPSAGRSVHRSADRCRAGFGVAGAAGTGGRRFTALVEAELLRQAR